MIPVQNYKFFSEVPFSTVGLPKASDSVWHTICDTMSSGGTDNPVGLIRKIDFTPVVSGKYEVYFETPCYQFFTNTTAHGHFISTGIEEVTQGLGFAQLYGNCEDAFEGTGWPGSAQWGGGTLILRCGGVFYLKAGLNYSFVAKKRQYRYYSVTAFGLAVWSSAGSQKMTLEFKGR